MKNFAQEFAQFSVLNKTIHRPTNDVKQQYEKTGVIAEITIKKV